MQRFSIFILFISWLFPLIISHGSLSYSTIPPSLTSTSETNDNNQEAFKTSSTTKTNSTSGLYLASTLGSANSSNIHATPSDVHVNSSAIYLKSSTIHPKSSTNHSKSSTNHSKSSTIHPKSSTNHSKPSTNRSKPSTNHSKTSTIHPKSSTTHFTSSTIRPTSTNSSYNWKVFPPSVITIFISPSYPTSSKHNQPTSFSSTSFEFSNIISTTSSYIANYNTSAISKRKYADISVALNAKNDSNFFKTSTAIMQSKLKSKMGSRLPSSIYTTTIIMSSMNPSFEMSESTSQRWTPLVVVSSTKFEVGLETPTVTLNTDVEITESVANSDVKTTNTKMSSAFESSIITRDSSLKSNKGSTPTLISTTTMLTAQNRTTSAACSCSELKYPEDCGERCCAGGYINATPVCNVMNYSVPYNHSLCDKKLQSVECGKAKECVCKGSRISPLSYIYVVFVVVYAKIV
ncbi:uncharacterized protein PB18E9.04c-like [Xenia sp. Carnegie-2017]|uniref:uncharacterized protein PB18E9.04c-like n=1 Tax=Xenia sp. Carnegie-2017 TaxID=2897299 RepID=UPI001F0449F7|nr:uncharacterized protein PB18E9.04c-like [Xenia sp. Carnegie-2017]XP_046856448.1 uncharacterized protein PB18E9.04c-like [Xenia sp. Carnegie-2017]